MALGMTAVGLSGCEDDTLSWVTGSVPSGSTVRYMSGLRHYNPSLIRGTES